MGQWGLGDLGGLGGGEAWGTWGSGGIVPWQIWARPPSFSGGRAGLGHSQNPSDPMPQAWISALRRPSEKSEGRELVPLVRVGQIWAGQGPGLTLRNRWGSTQNWAWPNLARPLGPKLGPCWARGLWGPKLGPKNMKSWKDDLPNARVGGPHGGNGLYGTQGSLGRPVSPNPHLEKWFYRDSPISRKIPCPPLGPPR